ncbi:MAG: TonB C-terminal domain-containing protein [Halieaceae bacterium]|nr:MAG: TonB C-terminal domain-containing protein [Halieaceae bacterium]
MSVDRLLFAGLPATLTLLLHGGLLLMLVVRWSGANEVVAAAPAIQPIQATLVQAETLKPKPKPKKTPKPKPKPKPKPAPAPVPAVESKPQPTEVTQPAPAAAPELDAEQLAALTREELETLVDADIMTTGAGEPSLRDVVAATIQAAVINRWTRPPSARNGMVAVLAIQLVPTGEVVGVGVLQSSGDTAFDRSAMTAVNRVGRFPEVAKLDDPTFEANFRRFQLIFKPEDLRY